MHNSCNREQYDKNFDLGNIKILKYIFKNLSKNTGYNEDDEQIIENEEDLIKEINS